MGYERPISHFSDDSLDEIRTSNPLCSDLAIGSFNLVENEAASIPNGRRLNHGGN